MSADALETRERRIAYLEIYSAILLAVATVGAAWCSYQAARWSGVQSIDFSKANAARVESTRASTEAGQLTQIDVGVFMQWVNAFAAENTALADFYFERFRPEFKPAVEAWIATKPRTNRDAPLSPFAMPEYQLAKADEADALAAEATQATEDAKQANQRSDNYVLAVVLLASVLFFAGISSKFSNLGARTGLLVLGTVVLVATLAWVATFPITISI